jgi:hypothetical protein
MKNLKKQFNLPSLPSPEMREESGFGIVEFFMSALIIISVSASVFTTLTDMQSNAGYQAEVLSVVENTRVAMTTLERYLLQAGNNPKSASFTPVTVTSSTQVQLCSDLTGSAGGSQGDADGDILDEDENITIQYNSTAQSIELVDGVGTVQTLAYYISGISFQYYDKDGTATTIGDDVRKITVTISGASTVANPRTKKTFGITLVSDFTLPNRG